MKKRSIKITHAIYPIYAVCHLFDDYLWREMRNHMNGSTRMNNAATIVLVPFGFSPNGTNYFPMTYILVKYSPYDPKASISFK